MKKNLTFPIVLFSSYLFSQVGIGTLQPNNKSMLDVTSSSKGVLLPRVTTAERNAIQPASSTDPVGVDGLLIYNTDTGCYNYWNAATVAWVSLCQGTQGPACDPSTFANFSIDCGQFPTVDGNTYSQGQSVSGNTITLPVNVTKTGPYAITITSASGVSYQHTGTFTATGIQNVIVDNASGSPSSTNLHFTVNGNGITLCEYDKTATGNFTYTYTCGNSNPATPPFTIGTATTGSFTIPVTVTGTGNIPSVTTTSNGVSFTTTAISNATNATVNVTVNYSGTPTATPVQFNIGSCTYTFNANTAFSYTYNCLGITPSTIPNFTVGANNSGQFTIPVTVTGSGTIPALNQTVNGITFTSNGTVSNGNMQINYSGVATNEGNNNITLTGSSSSCTIPFTAAYGALVASSCSTTKEGDYYVETALTNANVIKVTYSGITTPGYVNLTTNDKNGMKWSSNGNVLVTTSNNTVTLQPVESNTKLTSIAGDSVPNTSEEISLGGNGANSQSANYTITNSYNGANQVLGCQANIDVKPKMINAVIDRTAATSSSTTYYTGINDSRLKLSMNPKGGLSTYWNVNITNVSGSTITSYDAVMNASRDSDINKTISGSNWDNGVLLSSFDPFAQGSTISNLGDIGAHAPWADAREQSDTGLLLNIGGLWYKYRVTFKTATATDYLKGTTDSVLILYGVYSSKPSGNVGTTSNISPGSIFSDYTTNTFAGYQEYWP